MERENKFIHWIVSGNKIMIEISKFYNTNLSISVLSQAQSLSIFESLSMDRSISSSFSPLSLSLSLFVCLRADLVVFVSVELWLHVWTVKQERKKERKRKVWGVWREQKPINTRTTQRARYLIILSICGNNWHISLPLIVATDGICGVH